MKRMIFAALVVGALFLPASAWAVPMVANGGFETGDFTSWTLSGNTSLASVQNTNVHSGSYAASFGEVGSLGYIDQTLTTVAGANYTLSFWLQNPGGSTSRFEVNWDGSLLAGFDNMAAQGYTQMSYNVSASGTSTVLRFGFRQDPSFFHFDDVSVDGSAVPEPGAFQLTLIGAAMIFAAGRFRRRRS